MTKVIAGTKALKLLREKTLSAVPAEEIRSEEATVDLVFRMKRGLIDVKGIIQLMQEGADINAVDEKGHNLLYINLYNYRNHEIIKFLIENGVSVDIVTEYGTPLTEAIRGDTKLVRMLIERGANVSLPDEYQQVPLMRAVSENSPKVEIVQLLIENGADVNAVDKNGKTPLMYAVVSPNSSFGYGSPKVEIVQLLIDKGADVNAANENGKTSLMYAAERDYNNPSISRPEVIRMLIENGADINAKDKSGKRALDYANDNETLKKTDAYKLLR